jgi:hypothetical protein
MIGFFIHALIRRHFVRLVGIGILVGIDSLDDLWLPRTHRSLARSPEPRRRGKIECRSFCVCELCPLRRPVAHWYVVLLVV